MSSLVFLVVLGALGAMVFLVMLVAGEEDASRRAALLYINAYVVLTTVFLCYEILD